MTAYVATLDKVKLVLDTRDPAYVNLVVAIAAGFNGSAWMGYSVLIGDAFVFAPNVPAIGASIIQISLYLWSVGVLDDTHWVVRMCKKVFGGKQVSSKSKKEVGDDTFSIKYKINSEGSTETILRDVESESELEILGSGAVVKEVRSKKK